MTGHIHDIPQVVGRPAGYVNDATGTQHVVYRGDADFNVINEVRWDGTGLHYTNLNLAAGGTPAGVATGSGDPAADVFRAQGTEHVVYRGFDNHVHELWKDASGWHHSDLTTVTGAPAAAGDPAGYVFDAEGSQHVIYRAGNGHLYELWWTATQGWNQGDLTAAAGSPSAAGDPGAYEFRAEGTQHVVYRTADGHLHEMWWRPGPGNHDGDLTIAARPPKPNAPADLTLLKQADRMVTVSWVDRSANEDGFEIRFNGTRSGFTDHGSSREVERNVTTADLGGLRSGYDYRVSVIAFNAGGDSASSNEVVAILPPRLINVTTEGTGASTVWTVTGSAFTPFGLAVIRFTNPAFQQVQFSQSAGADGKFVSRHSVANVSSGEQITVTAWEDADPDGTSANPIVTTCP
jgi:hypothetical protein